MQLTMKRSPDGNTVTLGKAEVGPNVGTDGGKAEPLWNGNVPNIDSPKFQEVLSQARKAGLAGATAEQMSGWLQSLGADAKELGADDPKQLTFLVGSLLSALGRESMPVPIPNDLAPTLSRQPSTALDARNQAGRNATERAVRAMRQHSPGFAAAGFDEQIALASEAIRAGRVLA